MKAPHVPVDVTDLIDAEATVLDNGDYQLYFPTEQFKFSFRTHPNVPIISVLVPERLYLIGNHNDDALFMEYTGNPLEVIRACQLTARSMHKSFPGEKMSLLPIRVVDATPRSAMVQLCHRLETYWILSHDDNGQLVVNDTLNN